MVKQVDTWFGVLIDPPLDAQLPHLRFWSESLVMLNMLHSFPFKCIFMYSRLPGKRQHTSLMTSTKLCDGFLLLKVTTNFLGMLLSVCLIATCQVPNSSDYAFLILSHVHGWLHWLLDYECTHPLIYFWSIWCIIHVRLLARVWWKGKRLSFKADSGAVASFNSFYCMKSLYCTLSCDTWLCL